MSVSFSIGEVVALRQVFGAALAELAETRDDIVVVTADLGGSLGIAPFVERFPDRYYNCGVAEASMVGISAGLAAQGYLPFALTFGSFIGRAVDHVRQSICHNRLPVVLVGSHGGISNGKDGPSAHAVEDIAIMRAMDGMAILGPSDPNQMVAAVRSVAESGGPAYLRLYREPLPVVFEPGTQIALGRARVINQGADVTLLAHGPHAGFCVGWYEALSELASIELIECPSVVPLDKETILASIAKTGAVVTVEDHLRQGGFGGAIAELLGEYAPAPLERVALTGYATSGPYFELRDSVGLGYDGVADAICRVLNRR